MLSFLTMSEWSPYLVGIGIGLLSCVTFVLSDKPIGCSTAFARTSGMLEILIRGSKVREMDYYRRTAPVIDWQWMLVAGIALGSFTSAMFSGQFRLEWVPTLWVSNFGTERLPRLVTAVIGGIILGFGARWAGGCTSGHGISGTLQLAVSGWLAVAAFFVGGIITAFMMYGLGG